MSSTEVILADVRFGNLPNNFVGNIPLALDNNQHQIVYTIERNRKQCAQNQLQRMEGDQYLPRIDIPNNFPNNGQQYQYIFEQRRIFVTPRANNIPNPNLNAPRPNLNKAQSTIHMKFLSDELRMELRLVLQWEKDNDPRAVAARARYDQKRAEYLHLINNAWN